MPVFRFSRETSLSVIAKALGLQVKNSNQLYSNGHYMDTPQRDTEWVHVTIPPTRRFREVVARAKNCGFASSRTSAA
jgi:hypothetical protein